MLNFKWVCFSVFLSGLLLLGSGCKDAAQHERYISETDTTYSKDIRSVSKKINADPKNAELYYNRSTAFFFEQNYKQAVLDIDYALVIDSVNALYYLKKGQYLMAGDTANAKEAEKSYRRALSLKKDFIDAYNELAYLMFAKQKYTEAEQNYTESNKLDPANPAPYFYLGLIAKEKGDTAKALLLFEKTLVYDSRHYDALMQLGNYYAGKEDKKALLFLDQAYAVNEFSDEALYAKALFLQNQGKYKDAAALYEQVAKMNPAHIFCRYNLAYINGIFNNYEHAISLLDEVVDLDPENADAYTMRGAMKEKLKNSTGAFNDYNRAVQLDDQQKLAEEGLKRLNISISGP
jgi:tetratricopeptide (TPR) repeat protein